MPETPQLDRLKRAGNRLMTAIHEFGLALVEATAESVGEPDEFPDRTFTIRARQMFNRQGIDTWQKLCSYTAEDVLATRNCGITTLREIQKKLAERGLHLKLEPVYVDHSRRGGA